MPLCTLHLLALDHSAPNALSTFLSTLASTPTKPLIVSRVIRWIILPTKLSTSPLLALNITWDLLVILPDTSPLPPSLHPLIQHHWHITAGIPSRLVHDYPTRNSHANAATNLAIPGPGPRKTTSSAQNLELSTELDAWIDAFVARDPRAAQPVSMLNLLSFRAGAEEEYKKYGRAFAEGAGSRWGGAAGLVGKVVPDGDGGADTKAGAGEAVDKSTDAKADWDEVALAQYPSIQHFRAMLADERYQAVNQRWRVGSLWDTCILMTSEVGGVEGGRARL